MAQLTPLDEKLGEVLGLAQAAQVATAKVSAWRGPTTSRPTWIACTGRPRKPSSAPIASSTSSRAVRRRSARKRKTRSPRPRDDEDVPRRRARGARRFRFLSMAEAGELCHWEIVQTMAGALADDDVRALADWSVEIQRGHAEIVRTAALTLAEEEARES